MTSSACRSVRRLLASEAKLETRMIDATLDIGEQSISTTLSLVEPPPGHTSRPCRPCLAATYSTNSPSSWSIKTDRLLLLDESETEYISLQREVNNAMTGFGLVVQRPETWKGWIEKVQRASSAASPSSKGTRSMPGRTHNRQTGSAARLEEEILQSYPHIAPRLDIRMSADRRYKATGAKTVQDHLAHALTP